MAGRTIAAEPWLIKPSNIRREKPQASNRRSLTPNGLLANSSNARACLRAETTNDRRARRPEEDIGGAAHA